MDLQVGNPNSLFLLWIVVGCAAVLAGALVARRRALSRFATAGLVPRMIPHSGTRRAIVSGVLVTTSLAALTLAMADVRWGRSWREVPQKGIEVMFVLDVSRSMLAEDVTPNRLARAQQQMKDLVDEMPGDRVGLVVFAGEARQVVPLTSNIQDFKQSLDEVGPHSVRRGGSQLGDAIRMASRAFLDKTQDHKAIFVLTDGEDHESDPVAAAKTALDEQGIRLFAIGLGDRDEGARIPVQLASYGRSYLQHNGQQVWSRMNGDGLQQVALAGGGTYIPAGTKQVNMTDVYHNTLANVAQADFESARIQSYLPRYPWFVGLALALLLADTWWPKRRRLPRASAGALVLVGFLAIGATHAEAASPAQIVRDANRVFEAGDIDKALEQYEAAAQDHPELPELEYNQAVAHYRKGNFAQARSLFTHALAADPLESQARFNLANCDYSEAVAIAEQDRPSAIGKLESAISHYRGALHANPQDTDARANIELARMLMEQLRQEEEDQKKQEQQQQQQEQEQQDQQQQENEKEQDNDQEQQDNKSPDQDEKQNESQDEQQSSSEGQGDQDPDSENEGDKDESDETKEGGNKDGDENDEGKGGDEKEPQDKNGGSSPGQEPNSKEPHESQSQGQAGQPSDEPNQGAPQTGSTIGSDEEPQAMTREEAEKMLQSVRDRDWMRRLEQLREMQRNHQPVDRDW